jgi:hypothetical protein
VAALQLSLALLPLAALAFRTPTCVSALHSSSTGGQPSGSDRFRVFGSTGCKPPTRIGCPLFRSTFGDPSSLRLTILVSSGLRPTILAPSSLRRTEPSSG